MKLVASTFFFLIVLSLPAQEITVSRKINIGLFNHTAPSVTGGRSSMLYLSDYSPDGKKTLYISENNSGWSAPMALPREFSSVLLNYEYGHFLTFNGDRIYLTNRRNSNGTGYNIWYSDRKENGWSGLQLLNTKINTKLNEGAPSISADGKVMYFVRCDEMSERNVNGCKIYRSFLVKGDWAEPEPIDLDFNSTQLTCPRIFPDKKTMIFSAIAPGGAGGYDFYYTKEENGKWLKPISLTFINTTSDETMASPGLFGHRIFYGKNVNGKYKIVEYYLPEEFRGENTVIVNYKVKRETQAGRVPLFVFDKNSGEQIYSDNLNANAGTFILNEGREYTLLAKPAKVSNRFFTTSIDILDMDRSEEMDVEFDLTPLNSDIMIVEGINYHSSTPLLEDKTNMIFNSIMDFTKTNQNRGINIELVMCNYLEDTAQSLELTEIIKDSVQVEVFADSLIENGLLQDTVQVNYSAEISSVGTDSLLIELKPVEPILKWEYSFRYHNNRTQKEAEELKQFLISKGVNISKVNIYGKIENPAESKPDRFIRISLN